MGRRGSPYNFSMLDPAVAGKKQAELDAEMVSLAVAANVTYFHLTEVTRQVDSNDDLAQMLRVVSVALSQVAPIYRVPAKGQQPVPLGSREVDEVFFTPMREGTEAPSLDGFCIRRGDLRQALVTLREARNLFGGAPEGR